ncbi:MAG: tetratricopeptide repeat protein [candidate division Zixibacteria bacterium]|nr:tetratricopeptide repeat protein [candidate division Zixibacteria bacterium]
MKKGLFALILGIAIAGCSKTPEEQITSSLQQAKQYLESFDFENAQKEFDNAAEYSDSIPYSHYGKALILEQQLYYYDALNSYLKAIELNPEFSLAYSGVFRIYAGLGYLERAGAAASRFYALEQKSPASAMVMARYNEAIGQINNAAKIMEQAELVGMDKTLSLLWKSKSEFHLHNFAEADSLLQEAITSNLTTVAHFFAAAGVFEAIGNVDSAMALSSKAVLLPEATASDIYKHFDRALKNNYYFEARQAIQQLGDRGAAPGIQLTLSMLLEMDRGNFVYSKMRFSDMLKVTPSNVSIMMYDLFSGGKQHTYSRHPTAVKSMVNAYMDEFDYATEVREFINVKIAIHKGYTADRVTAWRELRDIEQPLSRLKMVQLQEAILLYSIGQFDKGLKKLQNLRAIHIHHTDWLIDIADIYAAQIHKIQLAEETYDMALRNDKWSRKALINKVKMLLSLDRIEDARNTIDEFPHLLKWYAEINLLNGLVFARSGQLDKAFEIFKKYGQQLKGELTYFNELLITIEESYEYEKKAELALLISELANGNPDLLTFSARLFSDAGDFEKAQSDIEKALAADSDYPEARIQKARTLYGMGEREQAFDIFESVLDEDPIFGDVNYYFSQILSLENIDAPRATNLARSAINVFYDDMKAQLNLSEVYFRFGKYKFAYGEANKACSKFPKSALVWYVKGRAAVQLGRKEAKPSLQKAIELGLDGEKLIKAQELLVNL